MKNYYLLMFFYYAFMPIVFYYPEEKYFNALFGAMGIFFACYYVDRYVKESVKDTVGKIKLSRILGFKAPNFYYNYCKKHNLL